jgi:hypothetical protein
MPITTYSPFVINHPRLDLRNRPTPKTLLRSLPRRLRNQPVRTIILIQRIHNSARELPRRDLLREQNIKLMVRPVPRLREAEVGPDEHAEARAAPHEAGIAFEVPRLRVHHELLQRAADQAGDVGAVAGEADGFLAEAGGALVGRS